jgi:multicomponent Na+:H+ antiporter subunit B
MNSVVLSATARLFFWLMLVVSLYILYRGHNEPGGGFVGGLMAAAGFAILALADGIHAARRALKIDPIVVIGLGIVAAILSGVPGLLLDGSYLTHQWAVFGDFHIGTTLLFDIGVYLVVLGGILALVLRFYEGL